MIKKIISIMKRDEIKFKSLITRLGGSYYHTKHKNNEAGYYAIEVVFDCQGKFVLLDDIMSAKNYEFYYPEEIGN